MIKILFVCHGNICRSPMAEFIMKDLILRRGYTLAPANLDVEKAGAEDGAGCASDGYDFYIASAATDTDEIGNPIYPPARAKLAEHGIGTPENELGVRDERARLMTKSDYKVFDLIVLMDRENIRHSRKFVKFDPDNKVSMMLDYAGRPGESVADPWYTDDFDATWEDVAAGCEGLLSYLEEQGKLSHAVIKPAGSSDDEAGRDEDGNAGKELEWKELSREHIVQDKWIDFRRSAYMFPDGSTFEPFYSYSRRDYVVIVATDEEGRYICVRQFRQGIKAVATEFPAGGIERSDGKEYDDARAASITEKVSGEALSGDPEDPLLAAKRELREETGYESDDWKHLLSIPSNATVSDNFAHIYTAKNCRRLHDQDLDVTEWLDVVLREEEEIEKLIYQGDFKQAVHVMAWLLAKRADF